ncbi:MAG: trigger factor [Candidatus Omnitrophica bacterium]|nr:trigger factor [Candidatus Omnitrophota bacterium]
MKSRIKNIEECTKLLEIQMSADLVKKVTEEVYQEIKKVAKIPGFRVGMAPQDLLEKHHSKAVEEEVLKRLVPEGYKKALDTYRLVPVSFPRISKIDFKAGQNLNFEAEVDIRPSFKLKNYKKIQVKKKGISASKEEMDETLLKLRNMSARYNDVSRDLRKGDYAVCEVEAFVDGALITKKNQNMWILVDKEASLLGMGEELVGLAKGQKKEIEKKLPDNYPDKKYAGKTARFAIFVKEVKEKELPELNDEFAKGMNVENLEELKKDIGSQLFKRKENASRIDMQNQVLEKLLKDHRFNVPSNLVKRQKEVLQKRLETDLSQKGVPKDEIQKRINGMESQIEIDSKNKVQLYFILDDIARAEKIKVNEADIDKRLEAIAASFGKPFNEVKEYYQKEDLIGGLSEDIKESKVLELLLKEADVIEEN